MATAGKIQREFALATIREDLFAMGCHLDEYDRRVEAGEDATKVAADVRVEWHRRQRAQQARDEENEVIARRRALARDPTLAEVATVVVQLTRAEAVMGKPAPTPTRARRPHR